jgi:hypothetical protein
VRQQVRARAARREAVHSGRHETRYDIERGARSFFDTPNRRKLNE